MNDSIKDGIGFILLILTIALLVFLVSHGGTIADRFVNGGC